LVSASGAKTFTLGGSNTGNNTFAGSITNGASAVISLTKADAGKWFLSGANTYTGITTISGGTLSVATIGNGGVAGNLGQASSAAANLVLNNGTLQYTGATASTDRNFTLTAGATGTFDITTNNLTISGASTATTGALTKTGAGTLTLTGVNTYTGATTVNGGTLQITGGGRIYSSPMGARVITLNTGCTLVFDNWNWGGSFGQMYYTSANFVVNGGTLKYTGTSANATDYRGLTIGASGATLESATAGEKWTTTSQSPTYTSWARTTTGLLTLTGVGDGQIDQIIPGPGGVTKSGTGAWTLTTNNTYTGATTINDGTLLVNGSSAAGSTNTVNAGTLGGSGTIGGHVKVLAAGNLAPGSNGAGTLSIGGTLDISALAGGKLYFQLGAPAATSDKIAVTGGLTIGSGTLGLSDFNFTKLAGSPKGVYKLITSSGIIGTLDSSDLTGAVPGIFGNLTLGINGNDIELVIRSSGTLITVY
jgi:autotransporter-associated beta strand protein